MGGGNWDSIKYTASVSGLRDAKKIFARSATAASTGNYKNISDLLNPRKLKNGMRESCFADGFKDATPIIIAIDGTGSMQDVPIKIQSDMPKLIEIIIEQQLSDHPNIMFMCFDDERAMPPDAVFQMSQFEIEPNSLTEALNEMIIPGQGGGNRGEAYHLAIYAAANHTKIECYEKYGQKGFFFMICDEEPSYDNADPSVYGTSPSIAKEVFKDNIEKEIPMVDSMKKLCERYHVFIIRPGHTSHGKNKSITKQWQDLLKKAGENPQHVLEIEETNNIISTMSLSIGRIFGIEEDDLVEVLKSKHVVGVDNAIVATKGIDSRCSVVSVGVCESEIQTSDECLSGRSRN